MNRTMRAAIYRPLVLLAVCLLLAGWAWAQDISISVDSSGSPGVSVNASVHTHGIRRKAERLSRKLRKDIDNMSVTLSAQLRDIGPQIASDVTELATNLATNIKVDVNTGGGSYNYSYSSPDDAGRYSNEKYKSYSKSYPLDANDKIRLSNQFGRISVNTWNKPVVKVDVAIKVQAENDNEAQKLLDGVQIHDSKDGNLVSFRTDIERSGIRWGRKMRKAEIDYTVYMPASTDLDVEDSYGAINLPALSGVVAIRSAYGSVSAEKLSNPSNQIDGSYGSLKISSLNGARLNFSYGSADIDECNNLHADLSYGSFKMGRLTGGADFDLSYVGGFKIDEVASSFRKLNVDASYSSVSIGIGGGNNFNFDVTTTYGGFNYDSGRAVITSKTPPDGSRHPGPTKNYKGYYGHSGSGSLINIHTSYGGVNFN